MFFQAATSRPVCLSVCAYSLYFSLYALLETEKRERERMRGCVFDRHFRSLYGCMIECSIRSGVLPIISFRPVTRVVCVVGLLLTSSHVTLSLPLRSFCCPQKPWKRDRKMMNWLRGCCCCCLITPLFTRKEKNFEQNSPFLYWKEKKKKKKTINKENEIKIKYTKWKIMTAWSRSKRNRN